MTPGMQFRRWYRHATPAERGTAGAAVVVVLALLIASIAVRPDHRSSTLRASVAPGGNATAGTPGAAVSSGGGAASSEPGEGATTSDAGPATAGSASGSDAVAAGGDGATVGPARGPSPGAVAAGRTASDRGVTADAVRIGFLLQNAAGLSKAGFSTAQRGDGEKYVKALADWATKEGRAGGRKVVPVFRYTDPTSVEDQAAACTAMVNDAKVFGVVDVASLLDTASLDCLVNRSKGDTPLVHSVMWSRDWQKRSGGNEVSYQAAVDRISVTWARDLADAHWFGKGATIGILADKCPATEPTVLHVLAPALEARGAKVVVGSHDCNIQAVVSQPPNIATKFRLEGVTHVLTVVNFAATQVFISAAASQGFKPKYSTSDWFLNTSDSTAANFDPDQFDGAVGIASLGSMLTASDKAPYPGWELCSKIAVDAGLPPIGPGDDRSTEILSLCDNFLLLVDAFAKAGPNPTRAAWRQAVAGLGDRTSAVFGRSRFGPDKLTGSDFVHTVQWQRGCRCWKSVSDFRPAAA